MGIDDFGRCLDQLQQYTLGRLGMDERDVVPSGALADATWCHAYTLRLQMRHGGVDVVNPQPDVIQRRNMHLWRLFRIEWLHQVDLDRPRPDAKCVNVLVNILLLRFVRADIGHAEHAAPQCREFALVEAADRNLLQAQHLEWASARRRAERAAHQAD